MGKLLRLIVASMRRCTGRRGGKPAVEGAPQGISFDELDDVCGRHFGASLKGISYIHLSGWKSFGSYRLLLRTERRQQQSLIYKNAIYHLDHMPALAQLPVIPGPPEYLVYSHMQGTFSRYLPAVYLCREVVPGKHYQYLLEDLGAEYQPATLETVPYVVAELPAIHQAMQQWSCGIDRCRLLSYGQAFSTNLQQYVCANLRRYHDHTDDKTISTVLRLWPEIAVLHGHEEFHARQTLHPIHGDFNRSNILIHKKHRDWLKLIDWEWCGYGLVHADLASLLKNVPPEAERQALAILAAQENHCSPDEHRRLYHWCKLERGLLDAAFLAIQQLAISNSAPNLHRHITAAAQRALDAYRELIS